METPLYFFKSVFKLQVLSYQIVVISLLSLSSLSPCLELGQLPEYRERAVVMGNRGTKTSVHVSRDHVTV